MPRQRTAARASTGSVDRRRASRMRATRAAQLADLLLDAGETDEAEHMPAS